MEFDNIPNNVKQSYQQAKLPIQKQQQKPKQKVQPKEELPWDLRQMNIIISWGKHLTWTAIYRWWLRVPIRLFNWFTNKKYIQLRQFLIAVLGPRVDQAEYIARNEICANCEDLETKGKHTYCGVCECPKWFLSRLVKKLSYKKYYCPLQKHSGEYPFSHKFNNWVIQQGCKSCRNKTK